MNILRWKRKSKNKISPKRFILLIFSLIMTTFAWFAYTKVINPTLNMHVASWDIEYYIGADKKTNPIGIEIPTLYPTMEEQTIIVDIYNNGETLIDLFYQIEAVSIIGTTYEIVQPGETNTQENYISLSEPKLETKASGEQIYKGVITNDITKFPFTIETELSAEVKPVETDGDGNELPGEAYMKITTNWIGDNDELDSEWGYKVGEYFANNPTATSAISIVLSIDSYQAENQNRTSITATETLERTSTTRPYLPTGFTRIKGTNLDTGIVITDAIGNEYVWVEVPKTTSVYTNAGISITAFTTEEYGKIETDLKNYVSNYTTRPDAFSSYDALGISSGNYTTLKNKMLKSIYQHGGFYIGRYETGFELNAQSEKVPVIKPNVEPYNYLTCAQAHSKADTLAPTGYKSSLLFGLQWDLVMKYLETKGATPESLKTDSTSWGNYTNNEYSIVRENAKYMISTEWLSDLPYEKKVDTQLYLNTGANTGFSKQNIYDLAGNLSEWTYNYAKDASNNFAGGNGGNYLSNGNDTGATASSYGTYNAMQSFKQVGFRVGLFIDDGTGAVDASGVWGDNGSGDSGETATTITFTINGTSYTATQGMTWTQWCATSNANGKFAIDLGHIYSTESHGKSLRYDAVGTYVYETETIIADYDYLLKVDS